MVTRAQKEDIANYIKEAVSSMLHDETFINNLADRVTKSLKTALDKNKELINNLENKMQKITDENMLLNKRVRYLEKSLIKSTIPTYKWI